MIHIHLGTEWREFQPSALAGYQMLGTISIDDHEAGALALHPCGKYCQVNCNVVERLCQRDVRNAIKEAA